MKFLFTLLCTLVICRSAELYQAANDTETRWITFENRTGERGAGGVENHGAKGHPSEALAPGETKVLMDYQGTGIVNRIWMTLRPRTPDVLRSLRLEMTWDRANAPAVSVPLGDFFCIGLGRQLPFENHFFSQPESRSFNCVVPMPFKSAAKITLTNESDKTLDFFYEIDVSAKKSLPDDTLYFHAHWNQNDGTKLGDDFEILPAVHGRGRYLGCNLGILTNPAYGKSGWCEGEVKIYLDGDKHLPTLNGTGTEDYIGTGWGMKVFANAYQGCLVADEDKGAFAFYRFHVPDPVYFANGCRVTIQQIGGEERDNLRDFVKAGAKLVPVSVQDPKTGKLVKLLEEKNPPKLEDADFPNGWTNFYRLDDYSATAYFYLDSPTNGLPTLASRERRIRDLQR